MLPEKFGCFVHLVAFCGLAHGYLVVEYPKSELLKPPASLVSVETKLGTAIGYRQPVRNHTINVFYGLPYAEPPTGKLRFKKSRPIARFPENPYPALSFKPHCYLPYDKFNPSDKFDEDCLYLNMWTPDLEASKVNGVCRKKYAVIIYLFGFDNSIFRMSPFSRWDDKRHLYNAELIPTFETIFIILNYRQRLFSSFYLHEAYPGNLLLFDQNLALQWTRQHIDAFCGDTERLTLNGQSHGAFATELHLISKISNRLFSTAIVQSSPGFFKVGGDFDALASNLNLCAAIHAQGLRTNHSKRDDGQLLPDDR